MFTKNDKTILGLGRNIHLRKQILLNNIDHFILTDRYNFKS